MSNFFPSGSLFISGLNDREARKLSRASGAKRPSSARSAKARATPGWTAGLFNKIPLKEVFISDKSPFSVGSDSICVQLLGNKVDSRKYGAKWNKYLLSILYSFAQKLMQAPKYGCSFDQLSL